MKKLVLSVVAFALITTSCNKYKDDFKNLNERIDLLAQQVQGVGALVAGIQASQLTLAQVTAAIAAGNLPLANSLAAITTTVNNINTVLGTVASGVQTNAQNLQTLKDLVIANQTAALLAISNLSTQLANAITAINGNTDTKVQAAIDALTLAIANAQANINATTAQAIADAQAALALLINQNNADIAALTLQLANTTNLLNQSIADAQAAILMDANDKYLVLKGIVDALTINLAIANAQIQTLLSSNNVFSGNLLINDEATLTAAEALGAKVRVITGNVVINTTGLDAAQMIRLKAVTNGATLAGAPPPDRIFIGTVSGSVTVSGNKSVDLGSLVNVSGVTGDVTLSGAAHDLSGLLAVKGNYTISDSDPSDNALLSVGGNLTLNYPGDYSYPNLTSVGGVLTATARVDNAAISFPVVNSATVLNDGFNANGVLNYQFVTSYILGGSASLTSLIFNGVCTSVNLGEDVYTGGSLTVWAGFATSFNMSIVSVNGPLVLLVGDLGATDLVVNLNSFVSSTGSVGIVTAGPVTGGTVNMPLYSSNQNVTINGPKTMSLPQYTQGVLSSNSIQTFTLPKYRAITNVGTQFVNLTALENITVGAAEATIQNPSFNTANLKNVNVTGTSYNANVWLWNQGSLQTVTTSGLMRELYIEFASNLTSVTTSGQMDQFKLFNNDAVGLTVNMGHSYVTSILGQGSTTIITDNDNLTSLTTSTDRMKELTVTGNTRLSSVNFSSFIPGNNITAGVVTIAVHSNNLVANYTQSIFAINSAPVIVQAGLATLKAYAINVLQSPAHAGSMATLGFSLVNLGGDVSIATLDNDRAAFIVAGGSAATTFVQRTGDLGGDIGTRINDPREIGYIQ